MGNRKKNATTLVSVIGLCAFIVMALASSSSKKAYDNWNGSYGQQTVQHVQQHSQGGHYVGNFSSAEAAKKAAADAGYPRYQYYPSTGECFGYK